MKSKKRYLLLVLGVLLGLSFQQGKAHAAASDYTADQAINWAKAQVGRHVGYDDGTGYYQCIEFIQAYYEALGVEAVNGSGYQYATNSLPDGWTRTEGGIPQKGDILVYSIYSSSVQSAGHVAIYESDDSLYDQDGSVYQATVKHEEKYYRTYTYNYWGCIHPNFRPSTFELDVNGLLDGNNAGNISNYGTFDIYINGVLYNENNDTDDYWSASLPYETTYEIKDIRPLNGKSFVGIAEGSRTGTLYADTHIRLGFQTIPNDPGVSPVTAVFNGHSYYFYNRQSTWYAAKYMSEALGGHLVTITSPEENDFVKSMIGEAGCWIGATDRDSEGNWTWVTGETWSYANWTSGQPDNYSGDEGTESYAHISANISTWNDNAGCALFPFVREIDRAYTITYNMNGGNVLILPKTQKAVGQSVRLSTRIPTRNGFTFLGWATSASAATPTYQPGDAYSRDANLTLYAVWEPNEYTITYDANGGAGAPEAATVSGGATTLSTTEPVWAHHRFLGWATSADAQQAQYRPGSSYGGGTVTLYAVWQRVFDNLFVLPRALTVIEDEAFLDSAADAVVIPASVTEIGSNPFGDVAVYGYAGSYAESWAQANGRAFVPISDGWVLAEQTPQGARVMEEKWTYRKTVTETMTSTDPAVDGWTQAGFELQQTGSGTHVYAYFPEGFDTGHSLYSAYAKRPLTDNESATTKRTVSASEIKDYIYWHWTWFWGSSENRLISDCYCWEDGREYNNFKAYENGYIEYVSGQNYVNWDRGGDEDGSCWWFRFDVYRQTYTDYRKLFTYTRTVVTDETSAAPVVEGEGISNVQHWVKYTL